MFDTGNGFAGLSFDNVNQMKNYGLTLPTDARLTTSSPVSGSGSSYMFTLNRIKLGPIDKPNLSSSVDVGKDADNNELPLVGQKLLEGW